MYGLPEPDDEPWELDPQFLQCRREMLVVFALFMVSFIWTVAASYLLGYRTPTLEEASNIPLIWGMPVWVFWAVLAPWILIDLVAVWFCFFYMQDEPVTRSHFETTELANENQVH
ncbi:MAG: DUF997 family protein [Pirellulaceae bacterium]|nr:DUF997 family protein [Pirellulaceae bacterium]